MQSSRFLRSLLIITLYAWLAGLPPALAAATPARVDSPAAATIPGNRVLFIIASSKVHGASTIPASVSFGEVVNAWDAFHEAGYAVDFVSPVGKDVPILDDYVAADMEARLDDARIMEGLRNTARPEQIEPARYSAVYYVGEATPCMAFRSTRSCRTSPCMCMSATAG